jgi:polar amino acid transport system substrate-binding protein
MECWTRSVSPENDPTGGKCGTRDFEKQGKKETLKKDSELIRQDGRAAHNRVSQNFAHASPCPERIKEIFWELRTCVNLCFLDSEEPSPYISGELIFLFLNFLAGRKKMGKNRIWYGLAGAFAMLCMTATAAPALEKSYINGIDANFPPFAYVDKTGNPAGFDVDAINWIADKLGFKVKHQPMDWDGIIPNLKAKKIDFIASGMSITSEREQQVNFSIPYYVIKQVFVAKKGAGLTVNDVLTKGGQLGVQRGTTESEWLKTQAQKNGWKFTLVYYDSAPLAIEDVLNGRIVAAAMDDAPAEDAVQKKPVEILGTFGMADEKFGVAVRKEDKELLDALNKGLKMLMADPYWQVLHKKYLAK